jgi:hypothetical protein
VNGWKIAAINRRIDLEPILAIEQLSFQWPWSRISFESELSCQNTCCYMVKEIGRRPKFYTDSKEDALLMMKDLAKVQPPRHEGTNKKGG